MFTTNVVHCHPPKNRPSLPHEIDNCRPYLSREIDIVAPRLIISLGRDARAALEQLQPAPPCAGSHDRAGKPARESPCPPTAYAAVSDIIAAVGVSRFTPLARCRGGVGTPHDSPLQRNRFRGCYHR